MATILKIESWSFLRGFGDPHLKTRVIRCNSRVFGFLRKLWTDHDVVIDLQGLSRTQQRTFVIGLTHRIFRHSRRNNLRGEILRTLFFADEGGAWFNEERDSLHWSSNEALKEIMQMGREFGIGWYISAQQPNMISKIARQNAQYKLTFRVESSSIDEVKLDFGLNDEQTKYVLHKLEEKFVFVMTRPDFAGLIMGELIKPKHYLKPMTEAEYDQRMGHIISVLQTTTVGPALPKPKPKQADSKQMPLPIEAAAKPAPAKPGPKETGDERRIRELRDSIHDDRKYLEALTEEPYLTGTRLKRRLGINKRDLPKHTKSLNLLLNNGFIEEVKFAPKTRTATFYALTKDAHDLLENTKVVRARCPSKKRFEHSYFIEMIKAKLIKEGHKAKREYGNKAGRIDVYTEINGEKIAIEVILTDQYYMDETLTKCFGKLSMDMVIIAVGRDGREKAEREINKTKYAGYLHDGRLKIESVRNLI